MHIIIRDPSQIISVLVAEKERMKHGVSKTQPNAFPYTMPSWECGHYTSLPTCHGYLKFRCGTACIF